MAGAEEEIQAKRAISIAATHPLFPQAPEGGERQPHRPSWPSRRIHQGPADGIMGGVRMCMEPQTCGWARTFPRFFVLPLILILPSILVQGSCYLGSLLVPLSARGVPATGDIGRNMRTLHFRGASIATGCCLWLAAVSSCTDVCSHGHGVDAEKINNNGIPLSILTSDKRRSSRNYGRAREAGKVHRYTAALFLLVAADSASCGVISIENCHHA